MWQRDAYIERSRVTTRIDLKAEASFSLEVTPTFSIEKDPFALQSEENSEAPIELRLNGNDIALPYDQIEQGRVLRIDNISGVLVGHNELYVKASPPLAESSLNHGIRLVLLENDAVIADKTIWGSHGALVSGSTSFETGLSGEDHDH